MPTSISALQRNASAIVRKVVASGVAEAITDRGRIVAVLTPPPRAEGLQHLREAGLTRPADPEALARALASVSTLAAVGLGDALAEQRNTDR